MLRQDDLGGSGVLRQDDLGGSGVLRQDDLGGVLRGGGLDVEACCGNGNKEAETVEAKGEVRVSWNTTDTSAESAPNIAAAARAGLRPKTSSTAAWLIRSASSKMGDNSATAAKTG